MINGPDRRAMTDRAVSQLVVPDDFLEWLEIIHRLLLAKKQLVKVDSQLAKNVKGSGKRV
jgi:hypothetical protein